MQRIDIGVIANIFKPLKHNSYFFTCLFLKCFVWNLLIRNLLVRHVAKGFCNFIQVHINTGNFYSLPIKGSIQFDLAFKGLSDMSDMRQDIDRKRIKRTYHALFLYHCFAGCKFRHRAAAINQQFVYELKKYIPRPEMAELYKIVLQEAWHNQTAYYLGGNKKGQSKNKFDLSCKVGMTRFELATPRPPDVCATGLRYIPKKFCANLLKFIYEGRKLPEYRTIKFTSSAFPNLSIDTDALSDNIFSNCLHDLGNHDCFFLKFS